MKHTPDHNDWDQGGHCNAMVVDDDGYGDVCGYKQPLPQPTRPSWDEYFLAIAEAVSARADCTRRKVGAVLVDIDHRIIGTGYNGTYPGNEGCLSGACPRGKLSYEEQPAFEGYGNCIAVHAEVNALLFARQSAKGATCYVTAKPCPACEASLLSAGVARVVHPHP